MLSPEERAKKEAELDKLRADLADLQTSEGIQTVGWVKRKITKQIQDMERRVQRLEEEVNGFD